MSVIWFVSCNSCKFDCIIDLTHGFDNTTLYWKGVGTFNYTKDFSGFIAPNTFLEMKEFSAGEHGGTHCDAPRHFNENGAYIGQFPIENFFRPGE